ncbi:MAG: LssY C-terminal domain-containing protein [Porticoccaceae bacterium]
MTKFYKNTAAKPAPCTTSNKTALGALLFLIFLSACSTAPYTPEPMNVESLRQRAEIQIFEPLTVKAAVPGEEESASLFGVPLYANGIQPVWLEISNQGDQNVRFALSSVDSNYFSPLEVSYKLRGGFSEAARHSMDKRFYKSGISRFVAPGETISGFVFTHLSPGTKSFSVDLFGMTETQDFAFFINVPGFVPDHANINFDQLYADSTVRDLSADELRDAIDGFPVNTTDEKGEAKGLPVNAIIVGDGIDVLRALLRAGWYESLANSDEDLDTNSSIYHLYGRQPDAIFRIQRENRIDRNEMRLWLAPILVDGEEVWLAQVTNFVGQRRYQDLRFSGAHLDPDVDDARSFMMQNIWYKQGMKAFAWSDSGNKVPFDKPLMDFDGSPYFTDGKRIVAWVSGTPYSVLDTILLDWDKGRNQ